MSPSFYPLIPAKAGTQTQDSAADWTGGLPIEPTSELLHLDPGLRRDERGAA